MKIPLFLNVLMFKTKLTGIKSTSSDDLKAKDVQIRGNVIVTLTFILMTNKTMGFFLSYVFNLNECHCYQANDALLVFQNHCLLFLKCLVFDLVNNDVSRSIANAIKWAIQQNVFKRRNRKKKRSIFCFLNVLESSIECLWYCIFVTSREICKLIEEQG